MEFWREIECSGVRSLGEFVRGGGVVEGERGSLGREDVHGRFVVRAQEADAFFRDLGELEEGDHLEAGRREMYQHLASEI
jgi:hypothetical protein